MLSALAVVMFLAGCCAGAAAAVLATGGRRAGAPAGPEGWGSPSRAPGDEPREGASRCVYGSGPPLPPTNVLDPADPILLAIADAAVGGSD